MSGHVVEAAGAGSASKGAWNTNESFQTTCPELARAAWEGLNGDSGVWIMVIRQDQVLVHANDAVLRAFGGSSERSIGRPVCELIPESICVERLECYDRVMREQKAIFVEGVIGGSMVRCALRPLLPSSPGGPSYVLCISRPIGPAADPCPHPRVRATTDDWGALGALTDREMEVLRLIGRGMTTAQIAKEMHRSVKTIEWHRVSLGAKLGAANRVDLARMAIHFGLAGPLVPSGIGTTPCGPSPMAMLGDAPK